MTKPPKRDNAGRQPGEGDKAEGDTQRDFNQVFPAHGTQAARLLAAVLRGQRINPLFGWRALGIYRLSDTKFRLKEMGWPMGNAGLCVANRFGERCHVALYFLAGWAIAAAGEHGQEFALRELDLMAERRAA